MSKYTTEVRWLCEQFYNDYRKTQPLLPPLEEATLNQIIAAGCDRIFWKNSASDTAMHYNNQFPIYDENHRLELCFKIIKHYYTREIAAETFGLWQLWLNERMNEIMPYYNQLYESADIKYNPLYDVDYKRSGNKSGLGTTENKRENDRNVENSYIDSSNGTSNNERNQSNVNVNEGDSEKINKFSETPQNGLSGVVDGTYLTTANVDTENHNDKNTESSNIKDKGENESIRNGIANSKENEEQNEMNINTNSDNWEEEIKGKIGGRSYAKMIMEYRDAILNIDNMIIKDLKDLFFYLW